MARARSSKKGIFSTGVWDRSLADGEEEMSARAYVTTVVFVTLLGIATVTASSALAIHDNIQPTLGLSVFVLVLGLAGCFVSAIPSVFAKTLGLVMIAGPFGLLLGPVAAQYHATSVVKIASVTLGMTAGLGAIGIVYPKSLEGWGSFLLGGLWALLFAMIIVPFGAMFGLNIVPAWHVLDALGIVLFSGLIIYDFNRAMRVPKTFLNAFDVGIQIYLDVINVFLRLLELFGQKKN